MYLSVAETGGARISFTANKNCMAHTSKQHKFNDNDNAHKASVTSYTIAYSSGDEGPSKLCCDGGGGDGGMSRPPGDIFNRNISDRRASRSDTKN